MKLFRVDDFPEKTAEWMQQQAAEGHLWILGGFDDLEVAFMLPLIDAAAKSGKPVVIHIESGGGSTVLYDYIAERLPDVSQTIAYSYCQSTALQIFTLGKDRVCRTFTMFMAHETESTMGGTATDSKLNVEWMDLMDRDTARWLAAVSNRSLGWWKKKIESGAEFNFFGDEAKKLGIATTVI